jgi:hypothetical protein
MVLGVFCGGVDRALQGLADRVGGFRMLQLHRSGAWLRSS